MPGGPDGGPDIRFPRLNVWLSKAQWSPAPVLYQGQTVLYAKSMHFKRECV